VTGPDEKRKKEKGFCGEKGVRLLLFGVFENERELFGLFLEGGVQRASAG